MTSRPEEMNDQDSIVDLTADAVEAKRQLEPLARQVNGTLQLWSILTAAHRMAAAYVEDLGQLRFEAKMAYTKAIVSEYWRPWSGNENNSGLTSAAHSKELSNLTRTDMHEALKELRNCLVAHADEGYEGRGIALLGHTAVNSGPSPLPRTLTDVFVPASLRIASSRSLWWLQDADRIGEMRDHIGLCTQAAVKRIHVATRHLLKVSLEHVQVLKRLDLFTVEPLQETSPGQVKVPDADHVPEVPQLDPPIQLRMGDEHVRSMVTVYSPSAYIQEGKFRGDGFVINIAPGADPDSLQISVSFPSRRETSDEE